MLSSLFLNGCSEKPTNEKQQAADPTKPSTQVIEQKAVTEPESAAQKQDRNSNIVNPINKRNGNYVTDSNTLDQFIKKIQPQNEQLQKVLKEDLDRDGKPEYVLAFGLEKEEIDNIFVAREDTGYHIIGKLEDPVMVAHLNTDMKIMKLDQTEQKFIVVYSTSEVNEAEGFSIFTLDHNRINNLNYNYPEATGQGIRKLEDINKDGVYEDVSYYRFQDTQQHTIITYQKFDSTGPEKTKVLYENKNKKFVYPMVPTDIIQNYLEDHYLMNRFFIHLPEMAEFTALSASPKNHFEDIIDFSAMDYTGLDLNIKEIANEANQRTFLVRSNSSEEKKDKGLVFTLEKQSGKWKIMSIEMNDKL
ncbi:hypothetical protein [Paenibacillus polymyxa]|uniref:Uncharacterized protein n=1 Tax=Paenibacillus polymyxa (strain SC2) TaxID=886882 RepID=E3EAY1_PAEPS|nr:hypothetical protein [Paenibacillus polymyxa]ADO59045.2 hypothetical protein PPSC2_23950 [Paenibacillus polymyxa SC2]WPQ56635.1 hypothetical protein SKN87_24330 [Paenibacillus polymyxa]CCI71563.1 hypothetical protein PPM_4756 [Paenibacillus polymyxa M1]